MASLLPRKGRILDGGCGHGLLSLTLALDSPERSVEGIDHSNERIATARKAGHGLRNLSFRVGDFRRIPPRSYRGIALVDVLHYLPYQEQTGLIENAFRRLERGGVLLFRDVDHRPGLASLWNRVHEALMTSLGFTKADGLHFRSRNEWARLARQAGFQVTCEPTGRFPFADVLFRCRKPQG